MAQVKGPVRLIVERSGLKQKIKDENFFTTLESAVMQLMARG
jgi:hypothetical protein